MHEKPIIFTPEMVRAIRDKRKSQTRRVINPQPKFAYPGTAKLILEKHPFGRAAISAAVGETVDTGIDDNMLVWVAYDWAGNPCGISSIEQFSTRYLPGDILWVRETWRMQNYGYIAPGEYEGQELQYRADFTDEENAVYGRRGGCAPCKWKPSIHMPRTAARIFLRVTDVWVERLQDIDSISCVKEGVEWDIYPNAWTACAKPAFIELWNSINAKRGYGWDTNPWVEAYKFELLTEDAKCE